MIFVDASYWIGRALPRDSRHDEALALERVTHSERLATSELVLGETWTILRRRLSHAQAFRALDAVRALPGIRIAGLDAGLEAEAWAWLGAHPKDARAAAA